jgi:hypothetical protein
MSKRFVGRFKWVFQHPIITLQIYTHTHTHTHTHRFFSPSIYIYIYIDGEKNL